MHRGELGARAPDVPPAAPAPEGRIPGVTPYGGWTPCEGKRSRWFVSLWGKERREGGLFVERKEEPGSEVEDAGRGPWKLETVRRRDGHQGGDGWQWPGLSQAAGGRVAGQDGCDSGDPDSGAGWPRAPWARPSAALSPTTGDFSSLCLCVLKYETPLKLEPALSGEWGEEVDTCECGSSPHPWREHYGVSRGPQCCHCFTGTRPGSPVPSVREPGVIVLT